LAVAIIAGVSYRAWRSNIDLIDASAQREHASLVVNDLTALRAALEEAEARQRRSCSPTTRASCASSTARR
jgi:hypothetical protein